MTLLDFVGPQCALGFHCNTHLLWKTLEPVKSDQEISVLPTSTFADSRRDFDILLVPGGLGTAAAIEDDEILNFLAETGKNVRYVTSVCTGSLLLGAAACCMDIKPRHTGLITKHLLQRGPSPFMLALLRIATASQEVA
jgi:putative intracellular protease/amidase